MDNQVVPDQRKVYIGVETDFDHNLLQYLDENVYSQRFNFAAVPLFHPRFRRDSLGISDARNGLITRSDLVLESRAWSSVIVGKTSPWIDLDSPCPAVRSSSLKAFKEEASWASHLSVPAMLLPEPREDSVNYSCVLNEIVRYGSISQLWIRSRLCGSSEREEDTPWHAWNNLRSLCEFSPGLSVALEFTADVPRDEVIKRWLGEPVTVIIVPTKIFLTNRKGYPTLSQRHQQVLSAFFGLKIQFIIKGRPHHYGQLRPYQQYISYLFSKRQPMTAFDAFEAPYLDFLQAPLQPLMDNLESHTYETFERDPVKYNVYERAIQAALLDTPVDKETVLIVVGAGRGPLVRCSVRAAERADRHIRVFAIEKNPNAIVTLRNLNVTEKWNNVTIVSSDMRTWEAPEKADILVSELLGSFGDNELSPECLDGAQKFLKADGVCIPQRYTSFVAPLSSSKLWNEVKAYDRLKNFETPYVVRFHNVFKMAPTQSCFSFEHPNWSSKIDNCRYSKLKYHVKNAATLHGLAGYFDADLYGKHRISINPPTFSEGMFSWFPLYFPLRTPMYVSAGSTVEVHIWRKTSHSKVWYEWAVRVEGSGFSPIHNPSGRSYFIGL